MDEGESHILLAQYMAGMIAQSLKKIKGKNKILNQIHICNSIFKKSFDGQSLNSELGIKWTSYKYTQISPGVEASDCEYLKDVLKF